MRTIPSYSILVLGVSPFCLLPFAFVLFTRRIGRPSSASSELVVLHVSVRDRGGRYITGLTRDAFTVIDDAKPQTIEMFSADEVPASVGFLIDNSNSMRPSRERVVASAVAFAQTRASAGRDLRADVQRSGAGGVAADDRLRHEHRARLRRRCRRRSWRAA